MRAPWSREAEAAPGGRTKEWLAWFRVWPQPRTRVLLRCMYLGRSGLAKKTRQAKWKEDVRANRGRRSPTRMGQIQWPASTLADDLACISPAEEQTGELNASPQATVHNAQ